jgi:hypothetical protein
VKGDNKSSTTNTGISSTTAAAMSTRSKAVHRLYLIY